MSLVVICELLQDCIDVLLFHYVLYDHTNSEVAKDILDNFGEQVSMFKKVVPHDYRHMIELIKYYEKQGLTNEQAKVEAFNEARKGV